MIGIRVQVFTRKKDLHTSDAVFRAVFFAANQGLLGDFASLAEVELLPLGGCIKVWQLRIAHGERTTRKMRKRKIRRCCLCLLVIIFTS